MQASYNKHLLLYFCVPQLQFSCEPPLYRQSLVTCAIECLACGLKGCSLVHAFKQYLGNDSYVSTCVYAELSGFVVQ